MKGLSITEQGAGVFDLDAFFSAIVKAPSQRQKALVHPQKIDMRRNSTYFLPFSRQSVYATMMPLSFNLTLMNQQSLHSQIVAEFYEFSEEREDSEALGVEKCVQLEFDYESIVWPYFGNIKMTLKTSDSQEC